MKIKFDVKNVIGISGMVLTLAGSILTGMHNTNKMNKAIDKKVTEKLAEALAKK